MWLISDTLRDRSYWSYYWTSFSPYTVKTVTSTTRTTYTVWSVYATASAVASSSLSEKSSRYNFRPPYTATYLSKSSDPVTLNGAVAAPTAPPTSGSSDTGNVPSGSDSDDTSGSDSGILTTFGSVGSAAGGGITGTGILAAVLVAALGGLAFGL